MFSPTVEKCDFRVSKNSQRHSNLHTHALQANLHLDRSLRRSEQSRCVCFPIEQEGRWRLSTCTCTADPHRQLHLGTVLFPIHGSQRPKRVNSPYSAQYKHEPDLSPGCWAGLLPLWPIVCISNLQCSLLYDRPLLAKLWLYRYWMCPPRSSIIAEALQCLPPHPCPLALFHEKKPNRGCSSSTRSPLLFVGLGPSCFSP